MLCRTLAAVNITPISSLSGNVVLVLLSFLLEAAVPLQAESAASLPAGVQPSSTADFDPTTDLRPKRSHPHEVSEHEATVASGEAHREGSLWGQVVTAVWGIVVAVVLLVINEWTKRLVFDPAARLRTAVEKVALWLPGDGYALANMPADDMRGEPLARVLKSLLEAYAELRVANRTLVPWKWVRWLMRVESFDDLEFVLMGLLVMNNEAHQRFDQICQYSFNDIIDKLNRRLQLVNPQNQAYQEELRFRR